MVVSGRYGVKIRTQQSVFQYANDIVAAHNFSRRHLEAWVHQHTQCGTVVRLNNEEVAFCKTRVQRTEPVFVRPRVHQTRLKMPTLWHKRLTKPSNCRGMKCN